MEQITNVIPAELLNVMLVAVAALVTFVVTAGVKGFGKAIGKELSKPAKSIAAIVSAGVVGIAVGLLNLAVTWLSPEALLVAKQVFSLIVVVLSAMGIQYQSKK